MGLLDQLGGLLGGQEHIERLANGQGNFNDPSSPDHDRFGQMLSHADPQDLQNAIGQATQQTDPQDYADHITPGVGGTNPLANVGRGGLSTIASALMGNLMGHGGQSSGGGGGILGSALSGLTGGGGGGGMLGGLLNKIPGLRTTDPNQMDESQVAALANYTRQNHPDAFSRATSQIGQQNPGLLQHLLGNKMLMGVAAGLAMKFLSGRGRH
jgi:hypothetical protein